MKMKDRVVIVTGGSSGIGKAASIFFAKEGAVVIVADKIANPREGGKDTVSEILDMGGISIFRKTDMTAEKDVSELFDFVVSKYSKVDVVVNNAAISLNKSVLDTSADEFMQVIDNNLKSAFLGCKYAIKHMLERKQGRIVNIGSNFSFVGRANLSAYVASKAGITGLTRALAVETAAMASGSFPFEMDDMLAAVSRRFSGNAFIINRTALDKGFSAFNEISSELKQDAS